MSDVMAALWRTIVDRRERMPEGSYTVDLLRSGLPRVAQKVGEEAVETVVAALGEGEDRVVYEMADLMYHCLVLLAAKGLEWPAVESELARRAR